MNSKTNETEPLDRKVVCLSAGTAAVHLALLACGVGSGDEVCVQSFTFCASSHPITYLGAKPVFIGSEPETWNMEPALLEKAIIDRKEKTGKYPKAIVPVALYGMPYKIDEIMAIADKYGIPIVEDAAEGMGLRFNGQVLGTFGKYGVLSFNGNKMITTSGGGALVCRNAEDANEVMWYATQARDAYPYYQHTAIGYNYRMSNVCAGIGRGQMTVLDAHIAHHRHVQKLYEELLADVPGVHIHKQPEDPRYDANFWLCAATLDPSVHVQGQENAYKEVIKTAVGEAMKLTHENKTIKWVFVGDGSKKQWLDSFIEQNCLKDTAVTFGRFPFKAMPAFFKKANAMLVSLAPGFRFLDVTVPARLQSYMSAARPVLAMLGSGGAEIIKDSDCGYAVAPGDYKALVKVINENVLTDLDGFEKKGENGRKFFEKEFDMGVCIDHLEAIIKG